MHPKQYDAVLGGKNSIPLNAAVLGGIPGVKSRLASPIVEVKIAALSEALKYGEAGLNVIIQTAFEPDKRLALAALPLMPQMTILEFFEKTPIQFKRDLNCRIQNGKHVHYSWKKVCHRKAKKIWGCASNLSSLKDMYELWLKEKIFMSPKTKN